MAIATTTALTIAAVAGAVGTGVSMYGQYQQGEAAKKAGEYNAQVQRNQALQGEMNATEQISRERVNHRKQLARLRAGMAGSGVVQSQGSPLDALSDTANNLELEVLDIHNNANNQSRGLHSQASMSAYEGKQAKRASYLNMGSTFLNGVSQAASSYSTAQRTQQSKA